MCTACGISTPEEGSLLSGRSMPDTGQATERRSDQRPSQPTRDLGAGCGVPSLTAFFGSLAITRQTQVIGFAQ